MARLFYVNLLLIAIGGALGSVLRQDLPIVIEIVVAPDKIEAFMPDLEPMAGDG